MACYGLIKVGSIYNPFSPNGCQKEGYLTAWIDEDLHGKFNLKEQEGKVYAIVKFNRKLIPRLECLVECVHDDKGEEFARCQYFDLTELANIVKDPNIETRWRGLDTVEPIDLTHLDSIDHLLSDSRGMTEKHKCLHDLNVITSGTFLIGSGGGDDYSLMSTAEGDLGTMVGAINFQLNSNITDTARADFNNNTGGFKITVESNSPHGGDVNVGYTMEIAQSNSGFNLRTSGGGMHEVKDLQLKRTVAGSNTLRGLINSSNTASEWDLHDLLLDGNNLQGAGLNVKQKPNVPSIYNCLAWDADNGIYIDSGTTSILVENCMVRNCTTGFRFPSGSATANNLASFSNTTGFVAGGATGTSLSSTDTSTFGTGANPSLTETDEVLSTDDTSSDFMKLKAGGANDGGGVVPSVATVDMVGTTYASPYPIGSFMLLVSATGNPYYYYLQQQLLAG